MTRIQSLNTMVSPLGERMNSCDNIFFTATVQDIESHAHLVPSSICADSAAHVCVGGAGTGYGGESAH